MYVGYPPLLLRNNEAEYTDNPFEMGEREKHVLLKLSFSHTSISAAIFGFSH